MPELAIDCEMVGSGNESVLARVSIVDKYGSVKLDEFVKPTKTVTDYRTSVSGITEAKLRNYGKDPYAVKQKIASIIHGNVLVGHSLDHDLKALGLSHPQSQIKDLSRFGKSLKDLAYEYLGRHIQGGQHDSVEDAKAAMDIYNKVGHRL